jgi:hypothetical protein
MFEAKLSEGVILKKIVDSIKDIVTDVNIDISPNGKCNLAICKRFCDASGIFLHEQIPIKGNSMNRFLLSLPRLLYTNFEFA